MDWDREIERSARLLYQARLTKTLGDMNHVLDNALKLDRRPLRLGLTRGLGWFLGIGTKKPGLNRGLALQLRDNLGNLETSLALDLWVPEPDPEDVAKGRDPAAPLVSVIILAYGSLFLTARALRSVLAHSQGTNLEIIVVDNGSSDRTLDYLLDMERRFASVRVIANGRNLGYAAGNNRGLAAARGDYVVLLNNDTIATPGWIKAMLAHFAADSKLGLLGPVTNNIGNNAKIDTAYHSYAEMLGFAVKRARGRAGRRFDISGLGFFCVMVPRKVLNQCGMLSEEYGLGWFEDDDYCNRVKKAGYRLACAEDAFIHHELSASFYMLPAKESRELFARNRAIYEAKWGPWVPHHQRPA